MVATHILLVMPAQWDVVGLGATSVDYVYRLPAIPQSEGPASKMRIASHAVLCGGQMATALAACAALGLRAKFIGATGSDQEGRRIREELATRGVDVSDAITRDAANQYAVILIDDRAGERIVLWDRDDRLALASGEIRADAIRSARVLHVDDVDEHAAIRAAAIARESGVPVTSDIDRITAKTADLVAAVTIPIFNEHVPVALTGQSDLERAIRLLRRPHHQYVCATMGVRGSMLLVDDRIVTVPAFEVPVVDTTGAGDVFRGAFIYGMLRGFEPAEMLRFANATAAVSCTRRGAINGVPTLADVQQLMAASA